jgi:hypothetical protein
MRRLQKPTRRLGIIGLAGMLLTSCGPGSSEAAICRAFPAYDYSAEVQAQAARELYGLPAGAVLPRLLTDYGDWRARRRAVCR